MKVSSKTGIALTGGRTSGFLRNFWLLTHSVATEPDDLSFIYWACLWLDFVLYKQFSFCTYMIQLVLFLYVIRSMVHVSGSFRLSLMNSCPSLYCPWFQTLKLQLDIRLDFKCIKQVRIFEYDDNVILNSSFRQKPVWPTSAIYEPKYTKSLISSLYV